MKTHKTKTKQVKQKSNAAPIYAAIISTPIGVLGLRISENHLIGINFVEKNTPLKKAREPLAKVAQQQLSAYFKNPKQKFTLPVKLVGTPLQCRIWRSLQKIPLGKTTTYQELALKIGTHPRVIGNACRKNPLPIIIPCHRVVAKAGLGGYAGEREGKMLGVKEWLLGYEKGIAK